MNQPRKPQLPAHIRRLDRTMRFTDRALDAQDGTAAVQGLTAVLSYMTSKRTPEELAAEARYERDRLVWNAYVDRQRKAARGRAHDREMATIRKAACPRCTMTHAGEC